MELVVRPESAIVGRSASDMQLRSRYGLNLLAVSREGTRSKARLRTLKIQPGDLLLMQGPQEVLAEFAADSGCAPLAERELRIPNKRKAWMAGGIMAFAVAVAAFGLLPAAISFALGVLASMALRTVPPRAVYAAIDWPVVVLLGALIPVGRRDGVHWYRRGLSVNADSFLMAVAIGAPCAFLTPIGYQNNTLILGPGGFRFGDYWRLGLPLEVLVIAVSLPMLLWVWPL